MPSVVWSRPEPFGAWVRLDDATLVAIDASAAARFGVVAGRAPGRSTRPLELHLAVTARCPAPCTGCYLDARADGHEPSFDDLVARLESARDAGVSTVAFGGGEPLTRSDLGRLAVEARRCGLVPVLTTSGIGLTADRAPELRAFAQVNVSHDGVEGAYEAVRGFDATSHAERAILLLVAAGVAVGVNVVLTAASFPRLEATARRAKELGAGEIQLLRYKPAGRADDPSYASRRLQVHQVGSLWAAIAHLVAHAGLRVRIDCAMVPLLSDALLEAVPDAAKTLGSLGVFGCEAARHLGAMTSTSDPKACSFFSLPTGALVSAPLLRPPVSPKGLPLAEAWDGDPALHRLRAYHAAPDEPCRTCSLFPVCRGGCQVVSTQATGGRFAPDPECPRVQRLTARPISEARS